MKDVYALSALNALPESQAFDLLLGCCHCRRWARDMVGARPYASLAQMLARADDYWSHATEAELLEAFSGHARIGDIDVLRSRYAGRATREQGQVLDTDESVIRALYQLNIHYERRHGFIFIVCASGKSAEAMFELLRARIDNPRERELINAAREQAAITRLRLQQLVDSDEQGETT